MIGFYGLFFVYINAVGAEILQAHSVKYC